MDIQGKTILVLGGWGLVGSAVCRKFMEERPRRMIVASLSKAEALEAVEDLRREFPRAGARFFIPWWGNIFVRHELKDRPREAILANPRFRSMFIDDILDELSDGVLARATPYRLITRYRPDVVVDCVNSATGIAYQDLFQVSRTLMQTLRSTGRKQAGAPSVADAAERLVCTLYIPQLIRHVQIMYRSMSEAGTQVYVKIGTSGTGGMGLNIPYTHSEERPSRVLLSKSAVAGAHTLLLFLMGRTPDAPITKEIKPTAAIAWKKIGFGEISKKGKPVPLYDCPPEKAVDVSRRLAVKAERPGRPTGETLRSVYIDTGENGVFSRGEFEAISTPGQMEFVTPEEIADSTVFEIKAGNTGHDIINALDNATLAPTYRAGFLFNSAMAAMRKLEEQHDVDSVAFEMLGPPRLSKLLYESYLLKLCFGDMRTVARTDERVLSARLTDIVRSNARLRSQIISIGIPILLPDGKSLLRSDLMKIPPARGQSVFPSGPRQIDHWAHDGWVDLRVKNMKLWRSRMRGIMSHVHALPANDTGSRSLHTQDYWNEFLDIDPGKVCGWIFTYEEKGKRMKA